jgi:hypothetical protein
MVPPKVYADFHNADVKGRVRLNCIGTTQNLARQQVKLSEGLELLLYSDDADAEGHPDELLVPGIVEYSQEEQCWVAVIDWDALRHASERRASPTVPLPADDLRSPAPPS